MRRSTARRIRSIALIFIDYSVGIREPIELFSNTNINKQFGGLSAVLPPALLREISILDIDVVTPYV